MADSTHPPFLDGRRGRWTWRGHGYALDGLPDVDWEGRPWTVQETTIRDLFGQWQGMTSNGHPLPDVDREAA